MKLAKYIVFMATVFFLNCTPIPFPSSESQLSHYLGAVQACQAIAGERYCGVSRQWLSSTYDCLARRGRFNLCKTIAECEPVGPLNQYLCGK